VPSRKEIQWSQLRVGALVLAATAVLIGLIFLMSGTTGGLFSRKIDLRCYFRNASGLKNGAPVSLEGVTIGNVVHVRIVPDRNPTSVEVTMKIDHKYLRDLHIDSSAAITQAGVLGDSYVDIDSTTAFGPPPENNAELKSSEIPGVQDVIRTSQVSIEEVQKLVRKIELLTDSLNSNRGTVGELINDPTLARKITKITTDLETITSQISQGKGSIGKMVADDTLYTRANAAIDHVNNITAGLDAGNGTAGKLLKDEALYKNLNSSVANANQLLTQINSGKGALGKLTQDQAFAKKLDDTVTNLDVLLKGVNDGTGTLGQLAKNRSLYDHADQAADSAKNLINDMRNDPKKYLVIRLKLF
jgi:phospholipid/cholesterol/gamma-HCH transport system substrate-binding protein